MGISDRDYMRRDARDLERSGSSFGASVSGNTAAWIVGAFVVSIGLRELAHWLGLPVL